jgi:hypothetical protein
MKYDLSFIPQVSHVAGILSSVFINQPRVIAVDHITIHNIDPDRYDLIFVLCAETTFKIRHILCQIIDKVVIIHTSVEPGLDQYTNYFFPHWLYAVKYSNLDYKQLAQKEFPKFSYNLLLGRAKDWRTDLIRSFNKRNLLDKGLVSYHAGKFYGPELSIDPSSYYRSVWEWEDNAIIDLYENELNYTVKNDSVTRLTNGHFSSCVIPRKIYNETMLSVVVETDFGNNHAFFTEKTWKPFLGNHHCIFYTGSTHEDYLTKIGFELYIKTNGDPEKTVNTVSDIYFSGIKNYTYPGWDKVTAHNYFHANSNHWEKNLQKWLMSTF